MQIDVIKELQYELIHTPAKGVSVDDLAKHCLKSKNYLYRISSPTEDLPFPLEIAHEAQRLKKNVKLYQYLVNDLGYGMFKLPGTAMSKKDENSMAAEYGSAASCAVKSLMEYIHTPTEQTHKKLSEAFSDLINNTVSVKKYCDKKASKQMELF